jgi:putative transposase
LKKPYQIENRRAMRRFERMLEDGPGAVQCLLSSLEVVSAMREGLGELMRRAGLELMNVLMEQEVQALVGERYGQPEERGAWRWGSGPGWCRVDGQKVPLKRPRVRNVAGGEVALGSYLQFQHDPKQGRRLWRQLMHGLTTRSYDPAVRRFAKAYGIKKSAVSEQFIEASRERLRELTERNLKGLDFCVVMIDGQEFQGECVIVALGIGADGKKRVLGLRQGATENTAVVSALLADLEERGLDFRQPRLYALDGGKALAAAVRKHAGATGLIQRCQVHKRRNVLEHLPEEHQAEIGRKLDAAWGMTGHSEARAALLRVWRELQHLNPSAARSLEEGLEETLTVHRLNLPAKLRRTLRSTNPIESVFAGVGRQCTRVKKWRAGDMRLRWVASALLYAEERFRRIRGYRELPTLMAALGAATESKSAPVMAVARSPR